MNSQNKSFTVYYNSFGIKNVVIRHFGSTESFLFQEFEVEIYQLAPSPDITLSSFNTQNCAAQVLKGEIGKINLTVRYGAGNQTLTNPIIIVEDFDERRLINSTGTIVLNPRINGYGTIGYQSIHTGKVFDEYGHEIFHYKESKSLVDALLLSGFDVVLVDFKDSWSSISKNGNSVIQAIDWVNQQLNYNQSFGALGIGTGGLMLNYALNKYEEASCCHNVELFVAFDTPFKGLNIPASLQYNAEYFNSGNAIDGNILGSKGKASRDLLRLISSDFGKDLLLFNTKRNNQNQPYSFQPLPQDSRNVSVINGSYQGNSQNFVEGSNIFEMAVKTKDKAPGFAFEMYYRKSVGRAMKDQSGGSSQNILQIIDAGTTEAGEYHRTHNELMGIIFSAVAAAIVVAIIVAIFFGPLAATAASVAVLSAAAVSVDSIVNNYNTNYSELSLNSEVKSFDNLPGSQSDLNNIFGSTRGYISKGYDLSDDLSSSFISEFCLVPTASALYTNNSNWKMDFYNLSSEQQKSTIPFDDFFVDHEQGLDHQYHAEFTQENTNYIAQNFTELLSSSFSNISQDLTTYYNFGESNERILGDVTVDNNGVLHLNDANYWGYSGQNNNQPPLGNKIIVKTKRCGVKVDILDGGKLILGSPQYSAGPNGTMINNQATLRIARNSTLELQSGSNLTIFDKSTIIIEEGGSMVLHPGCVIDLDGTESKITLQGKLKLTNNTIFHPIGSGIFSFDQQMSSSTSVDFLEFEGNNEMTFQNTQVDVLKDTWIPTTLDKLNILNTDVSISGLKKFAIESGFLSNSVNYSTSANSTYRYHSVQLFGQANVSISFSNFTGGDFGLLGLLALNGNPLEINNCVFNQCGNGLETRGKNVKINNCFFTNNAAGWMARDHDGKCELVGSSLSNNGVGVNFKGQTGSSMTIYDSDFTSNNTGVIFDGSILRSECRNFLNNNNSIDARNCDILLGNEAQNDFQSIHNGILLNHVNKLKVSGGFNIFQSGNQHIVGSLSSNSLANLHFNGINYSLDVTDNMLPSQAGIIPISLTSGGNTIGLYNWGPLAQSPAFCNSQGLGLFNVCPSCSGKTLFINPYNLPINKVIDSAYSFITDDLKLSPESNIVAMEMLHDVMLFVRDHARYGLSDTSTGAHIMDSDEIEMMDQAFIYYMIALSNSYRLKVLESNRGMEGAKPSPYLSNLIMEANYRLSHQVQGSMDPYLKRFWYKLSMAHAYRIGEHYLESLSILNNADEWAQSDELNTANYWKCVFSAESDLVSNNIDSETYLQRVQSCIELHFGKRLNNANFHNASGVSIDSIEYPQEAISVLVLPNPSNGNFDLKISGYNFKNGNIRYTINSATGRLIHRGEIKKGSSLLKHSDLLSAGTYFLTLNSSLGQKIKTEKLLIIN